MSKDIDVSSLLSSGFEGKVVRPSDPGYEAAYTIWAANVCSPPKLVCRPSNKASVPLILAYAKSQKLPISIKGGGHSTSGASSCPDGLMIDLGDLNSVHVVDAVDKDGKEVKAATVGGGALWSDVDTAAFKEGLCTVGGTVNHTGVGGLTLGGGYGFLTPSFGLASDNVLEFEIVLASGETVVASANSHPELYFGLRGGGQNFGIVTQFTFLLHPLPENGLVFQPVFVYPASSIKQVSAAVEKWLKTRDGSEVVILKLGNGPGGPGFVATCFYFGGAEEGKRRFKEFYDVEGVFMPPRPAELPYVECNSVINHAVPHGGRWYLRGHRIKRSSATHDTFQAAFDAWTKFVKDAPDAQNTMMLFEFVNDPGTSHKDQDVTAFGKRIEDWNVMIGLGWTDPANDDKAKSRTDQISNSLQHLWSKGEAYSNYESTDVAAPTKAQVKFGPLYPRLQEVKRKYDPENIFNRWYPIQV